MPLFLTIFEGPTPDSAMPLLATHDPEILAAVRQLLLDRLIEGAGPVIPLRLKRKPVKLPVSPEGSKV
jgi:hypothetical protein